MNEDDDQPGAAAVLAVSYAFWRKNFGGDADAVGTPILIAGKPFLVSGVTPPEFFGVRPQSLPDFYIPVHDLPLVNQDRYRDTNAYFADDHTYLDRDDGTLQAWRFVYLGPERTEFPVFTLGKRNRAH